MGWSGRRPGCKTRGKYSYFSEPLAGCGEDKKKSEEAGGREENAKNALLVSLGLLFPGPKPKLHGAFFGAALIKVALRTSCSSVHDVVQLSHPPRNDSVARNFACVVVHVVDLVMCLVRCQVTPLFFFF